MINSQISTGNISVGLGITEKQVQFEAEAKPAECPYPLKINIAFCAKKCLQKDNAII